jgi:hypothetical protein
MTPSGLNGLRGRSFLLLGLLALSVLAVSTSAAVLGTSAAGSAILSVPNGGSGSSPGPSPRSSCQLHGPGGNIQHVIYIQFDNVHFTRDNPNVPSDLEQMPALLNFMESNGVLFSDQQTPLISHTANDFLTSLTGVYPDRLGQAVANAYGYFNPDGTVSFGDSFAYWTDTVGGTDSNYNLLTASGQNAPAPWVAFTRAGCDVGVAAIADMELENVGSDVNNVFGPSSPQAAEAASNYYQAVADFEGIAVHCALGNPVCGSANGGVPDKLPDEPGGYNGFNALFGNKYIQPVISPSGPVTDLFGNVVSDGDGHIGFPGYDGMTASVALAYTLDMQEHGIPVTYTYISDVHDDDATGTAFGPGQPGYESALASYNQAFADFFAQLQNNGITTRNTLFVITADENDHFVGSLPTNPSCNGNSAGNNGLEIGEVDADLSGLLPAEGITTPFSAHFDSAPALYLQGDPSAGATVTRDFERAMGDLTAVNPISGATDQITQFMADPVELNLLHMVTADPARTPTFIDFANPDYYLYTGSSYCSSPTSYVCLDTEYAWNHGDVQPVITTTWLGLVGPGVADTGLNTVARTDHTDIRPTMMYLLGLKDDYTYDGRVLVEALNPWTIPQAMGGGGEGPSAPGASTFLSLAQIYEQINAPTGQFGMTTLAISTHALESNTPGDATYAYLEGQLSSMTTQRNAIASQMISLLYGAEFNNQHINDGQAQSLISQGQDLLTQANTLSALLA